MTKPRPLTVRLRSQGLAVGMPVLLAAYSALGTVLPADRQEAVWKSVIGPRLLPLARAFGFVDTYRSPVFIGLLVLLCLNIAMCTYHRASMRHAGGQGNGASWDAARLRGSMDVVMHLSLLAIVAGGASRAILGFAGTQYLFLGQPSGTVFHWGSQSQVPLGFSLLLKEQVELRYPVRARVEVRGAAVAERAARVELTEGMESPVDGTDVILRLKGFDRQKGTLRVEAVTPSDKRDFDLSVHGGDRSRGTIGKYSIVLNGYRDIVKELRSRVSILDEGREVKEGWLTPRSSIAFRGTSVYQITWGKDDQGFEYTGIQVSRDPAAPLFWLGGIVFSLSAILLLILRARGGPIPR